MPDVVMLRTKPFPPEPHTLRVARALADGGHTVRVVAWDRERKFPAREEIDGVEVRRVRVPSPFSVFASFAITLPLYWLRALLHALGRDVRVVHCVDIDTLPVGVLAKRLRGARVVFDVYEIYEAMIARSVPRPLLRLVRWVEEKLLGQVDLVTVVNDAVRPRYEKRRPTLWVATTRDPEEFDRFREEDVAAFRREHGLEGAFVVSYVGILMPGRGIEECVAACEGLEGVRFMIAGYGQLEPRVLELTAGSKNSVFIGRLPGERVPLATLASDAVMNVLEPANETYRLSVGNKVFEALMAGAAVIATEGTASCEFATQHGFGTAVGYRDIAGLRDAIVRLQRARDAGKPVRAGAEAKARYSWSRFAGELRRAYPAPSGAAGVAEGQPAGTVPSQE